MIFQELVLNDVGPFAGAHCIPLEPQSQDRPVVLLGGLNGSGKTTVLESLLLALYGGLTPGSARRAGSYEKYLRQLINRRADPSNGAMVELVFRAIHDGAWHVFRVRRSWRTSGDRVRETVEVIRNGAVDVNLTEAWPDHVEALAPRGVANLFFFDGEQIEAFADLEAAQELVRAAIGGLLGLDLVDRLQGDLVILERKKQQEAVASNKKGHLLESKTAQLDAVRSEEADARQAVDAAELGIVHAQLDAERAEAQLAREGGDRYKASEELRARQRRTAANLQHKQQTLVEALGGLGPLALVEPLLEQVAIQAVAERREADNRNLAGLLADRDAALMKVLSQHRATDEIQRAVVDFLAEDVARRKSGEGVASVLGVDPQPLALARQLLSGYMAAERAELQRHVDEIAAAQSSAEDAERAVSAIPDADAMEETLAAYRAATYALAQARVRLEQAKKHLEEKTARRLHTERMVKRELLEANATTMQSEEARRILEHAARARDTLSRLRDAAMGRHAGRIQALIRDSLQTLLRKERLVHEVKIDPVTCELELLGYDGKPIKPRTLSAGERQLLAVSLLAGLARASGRLLPVVIDTPLGRLDLDHRRRLIERYIPQASHQVIVLSTDTEITSEMFDYLGDSVSHMIRLEYDAAQQSSIVVPGYFALQAHAQTRQRTIGADHG
ncbi:DNA sulfur modification protein DndD [Nonomuraea sp. NPDC051191]|uniref:DNA sulfur modification protein DndD n=1 Tax=Nonomuraea sp. NPDC051191 TaxID=3364372 RepID=UPI0037A55BF8